MTKILDLGTQMLAHSSKGRTELQFHLIFSKEEEDGYEYINRFPAEYL